MKQAYEASSRKGKGTGLLSYLICWLSSSSSQNLHRVVAWLQVSFYSSIFSSPQFCDRNAGLISLVALREASLGSLCMETNCVFLKCDMEHYLHVKMKHLFAVVRYN